MKQWQEFAQQQDGPVAEQNFICAADELGLILVNGEDARDFLQNQLSNDINLIDETHSQLSSYSTPKGRMLGILRVIQISNGYLLVTARRMVLPLLQRLHHYIVQARVSLADASDYFARMAIQTDLETVTANPLLPTEPNQTLQNDSLVSLQLPALGTQKRFLLLCLSADEAIQLWRGFAEHLSVTGFQAWHLADVKAGIPAIYPETSEEFVLQMANLNALDGVSFKKGCYPGQEIVARMQYLGKLKRRMFLAQLETDTLPRPGDALVSAGKQEADGSGTVVDAEMDPEGLVHCLYIAQISKAENGNLELLSQPQTTITNVELPYPM